MKSNQIMEGYPDYIQSKIENRDRLRKRAAPPYVDGMAVELVFEDLKLWQVGVLTVSFRGGNPQLHKTIASVVGEWMKHANIKFDFGNSRNPDQFRQWAPDDFSHIRVGFDQRGYWSLVGTDSMDEEITGPGEISLNLEGFDKKLPVNWQGIVLHEFGHALGFHHEHQSPVSNCDFDWDVVYEELGGEPNFWPKAKVDFNLRQMPAGGLTYSPHDKESIMHYAFPAWMFKAGENSRCFTKQQNKLSPEDKKMAREAYPFSKKKFMQQKETRSNRIEVLLEQGEFAKDHSRLFLARHLDFIKADESSLLHFDDDQEAVEIRVKRCILIASGQPGEDPNNLDDEASLSDLLPTDFAFQMLADLLDELVKEYNTDASVSPEEVEEAETVKGCVKMVLNKTNQ